VQTATAGGQKSGKGKSPHHMVACQQMGERSWVSVAKPDFKNVKLQRSLA